MTAYPPACRCPAHALPCRRVRRKRYAVCSLCIRCGGPRLTQRQGEVLCAVVGRTDKECAHALGISRQSVKNHLSAIYLRLGTPDRTSAVVAAMRLGLIDLGVPATTVGRDTWTAAS